RGITPDPRLLRPAALLAHRLPPCLLRRVTQADPYFRTRSPTRRTPMRAKLLSTLVALSCASFASPAAVTDRMIEASPGNGSEVLSWGLGTQDQRYSPLQQITNANVSRLTPVWAFSFG